MPGPGQGCQSQQEQCLLGRYGLRAHWPKSKTRESVLVSTLRNDSGNSMGRKKIVKAVYVDNWLLKFS